MNDSILCQIQSERECRGKQTETDNIPPIVCAMEDADDLDDEELARMKPRPGIEKALNIEHQKALSRVEFASNPANKPSQALMAKIFG